MASKPRSRREEQARLASSMRKNGCSWREIADEFVRRWQCSYLQAFRMAHGISQEEAAKRYNDRWKPGRPLQGKHISYWEMWPSGTGKEPSLDKLGMLAGIYECSVSDLLADVGDHRRLDCAVEVPGQLIGPVRNRSSFTADSLTALTGELVKTSEGSEPTSQAWQAEYDRLTNDLRNWAVKMRRRDLLAVIGAAASAAYASPLWLSADDDSNQRFMLAVENPHRTDDAMVALAR